MGYKELTPEQQAFKKFVETPTEEIGAEARRRDKRKQVENAFTYHPPEHGQQGKYQRIRDKAKELAHVILDETPENREQSIALTDQEKVVMTENAAIARNN